MSIVEEEADESVFWLEVLDELKTRPNKDLARLLREASELVAITVASRKTAKRQPAR